LGLDTETFMTDTDFNDSLDNIFAGDTGPVRTAPVVDRSAAVEYAKAQAAAGYVQTCHKCRGSGQTRWGACFACKGAGRKTFKTSPEARAANRERAADRKVAAAATAWDDFAAAQPVAAAWIVAKAPTFDFAAKLQEAVARFGSLTEGQLAAVQRCVDRDVTRAQERTQRHQNAPEVASAGIESLKASFDQAIAYTAAKGLKLSPRITVAGITISPAKATSANPGALYVKADGTYLGKVAQGRFFASRECTGEQEARVLEFVANPAEAAKVYGQTTGTCCICNATLRSEWKHRGIGPVCAEKFGW
jgi:hypothetical protein